MTRRRRIPLDEHEAMVFSIDPHSTDGLPEDEAFSPRFVETVERRGYRLVAQVSTDAGPAESQPHSESIENAAGVTRVTR